MKRKDRVLQQKVANRILPNRLDLVGIELAEEKDFSALLCSSQLLEERGNLKGLQSGQEDQIAHLLLPRPSNLLILFYFIFFPSLPLSV